MNACVENAAPQRDGIPARPLPPAASGAGGVRPTLKEAAVAVGKPNFSRCAPVGSDAAFIGNQGALRRRWLGAKTWREVQALPELVHVRVSGLFAAVEQVLNPKLAGRPVLVGRGVVVCASREAQASGVRHGMILPLALGICPDAAVVPGQYAEYAEFAERVRSILETYTGDVQTVGLDNFYLRLAGAQWPSVEFEATLRRLQAEILGRTGLCVAVGAATTRTVAGTASEVAGPLGLRIVPPGTETAFLETVPVGSLHGIGQVHADALVLQGISTVGQLRLVPKPVLVAAFGGVTGTEIWQRARGRDARVEKTSELPNSLSRNVSIDGGISQGELLSGWLEYSSGRLAAALRESGRQACSLGVSLRYTDDFSAHRTVRLMRGKDGGRALLLAAGDVFAQLVTSGLAIRELRVSVAQVEDPEGFPETAEAARWWKLRGKLKLLCAYFDPERLFAGRPVRSLEFYGRNDGLVPPAPCVSR